MAQVSLQINGYGYILGCADGEEEHLRELAADLDRRIEEIKASTGPSGEARMLLMAALVVSDELHDLRELARPRDGDAEPEARNESKAGRRLRGLARRAEAIADTADGPPLNPSEAASNTAGTSPDPSRDSAPESGAREANTSSPSGNAEGTTLSRSVSPQSRAGQPGGGQMGASHSGVAQTGVAQTGVAQTGVAQTGVAQTGPMRSAVVQSPHPQSGATQGAAEPTAPARRDVSSAPPASRS